MHPFYTLVRGLTNNTKDKKTIRVSDDCQSKFQSPYCIEMFQKANAVPHGLAILARLDAAPPQVVDETVAWQLA